MEWSKLLVFIEGFNGLSGITRFIGLTLDDYLYHECEREPGVIVVPGVRRNGRFSTVVANKGVERKRWSTYCPFWS